MHWQKTLTIISNDIAVIGGGPAGLMAAQAAATAGGNVTLYDGGATVGRKFLLAGRGGLNLTLAVSAGEFRAGYGGDADRLGAFLDRFGPDSVRAWAADLGVETIVGSSGKVFPAGFGAKPLLRAWLARLDRLGVRRLARHHWRGWTGDRALTFDTPDGPVNAHPAATILAMGGASRPRTGSDGGWVAALAAQGIVTKPFQPSNCGFDADWSDRLRSQYAGTPLAPVEVTFQGRRLRGTVTLTATGLEGGPIYALSAALRGLIRAEGRAVLALDLKPDWPFERIRAALAAPRGSRSMSTHLARAIRFDGAAATLLREVTPADVYTDPALLAAAIKAAPVTLLRPRPLAEAISSAGGIRFDDVTGELMLRRLPGVYAAGEMLDWDAPTGGYLLTACLATGWAAGSAAAEAISSKATRTITDERG